MLKKLFLSLGCLAITACGASSSQGKDAGKIADAGLTDAGATDAGGLDAGPVDAGDSDAGSVDAGSTDAGPIDTGSTDAGTTDAGATDAGHTDAGTSQGWTVSGDVVIDNATGLSWDLASGPGGTTFGSASGHYTWQEAKDYCAGKGARLATYADLPGESEAGALAAAAHSDWTNFSAAFGGSWNSWSATPVDNLPTKAWTYYLDHSGSAVGYTALKDDGHNARCVR
jgi:hypothetical protein